MPTSPGKSRDKYCHRPKQIKVNGERIELGGVQEVVCHARWQFHRLLEDLVNNPDAPNWLDTLGTGHPELRQALVERGYAGLTRAQLLAKRDEYVAALEDGSEPYSDKLHGIEWLPAKG